MESTPVDEARPVRSGVVELADELLSPARLRGTPGVVALVLAAVVVLVVSIPAIVLRPEGVDWAIWAPASGVAVGVCLWAPRRRLHVVLIVLGLAIVAGQNLAGREVALSVILGAATVAEVAVAALIVRGRREDLPQLVRAADLAVLLGAALAGVAALLVVGGAGIALAYGLPEAVDFARVSPLAHLGGLLVVTPLFFDLGRTRLAGHGVELVLQWVSTAGVLALTVLAAAEGLPLAFVLLGPLVWGAVRFGGRQFLVQFLLVLALVATTPTGGRSLIAVDGLPPSSSAVMVQLFLLSSGAVVIAALALATSNRRLVRLSRSAIQASLTGFAEVRVRGGRWTVVAVNDAARLILGAAAQPLDRFLTPESARWVEETAQRVSSADDTLGGVERLTTRLDRILQATIAPLVDLARDRRGIDERTYSLQFSDITDSVRVAQAEEAERQRAAEVQRALLPVLAPVVAGWDLAAACRPSREVGGDFYAWQADGDTLSVSLGDVMGKGLGAGVMAASLQMAVSLRDRRAEPGPVVESVAAAITGDMERASTFATLFLADVGIADGSVRFADAGHGLALIAPARGEPRRLAGHDLPIGVLRDSQWSTLRDALAPGDVLIVLSDGVLDAFSGPLEALDEAARVAQRCATAQEAVERLSALAEAPGVVDDVTVVVVRRL